MVFRKCVQIDHHVDIAPERLASGSSRRNLAEKLNWTAVNFGDLIFEF